MNVAPLAVWDVDGTLVDSRQVIYDAVRESLAEVGLPDPGFDSVRQIVGLGLKAGLAVLAPQIEGDELEALLVTCREVFQAQSRAPGFVEPLYEGAAETLSRLKAEGWRIAMATGKGRTGVEAVMAMHGWADIFESTHCDDDGPGKPDPAMLLAAMQALNVPPARTIMIGDTAHDMRMARAAGVAAQGVSWGFHTPAEVLAGGADHVAMDFAELNERLDRFARD